MTESDPRNQVGIQSRLRWYVRWPLKWFIFGISIFVVCFPYPSQFLRHVRHVRNYDAMIDPDHPLMAAWELEFRELLTKDRNRDKGKGSTKRSDRERAQEGERPTSKIDRGQDLDIQAHYRPIQVQKRVERFVYERVPYAWDWDLWGSADYMPTVEEMVQRSLSDPEGKIREDCDGRAVMAASLLTRLGYDAKIVTDLRHVWVTTSAGELMGPGRAKTMESSAKGNRLNIRKTVSNVPVALSFGVAVFPLWRELVITSVAFLLLIPRRAARVRLFLGLQLMILGLLLIRGGVLDPVSLARSASPWPVYAGLCVIVEGMLITAFAAYRAPASSAGGQS